jgi:DNA-directed RNA polymerase specialized sigma24 family protein
LLPAVSDCTDSFSCYDSVVWTILAYRVQTPSAPASPPSNETSTRDGLFASTRWSVVIQAGDSAAASAQSLNALSELCQIYWRPLYLFLRREGYGPDDAQDLTQGFFADLIKTRSYARADRERGRFRSFLLGALKHFAADARDRDRAQKRGGGLAPVQLDDKAIAEVEAQVGRTPKWNADQIYDREWAASLLGQTLDRIEEEFALAGKAELFAYLKPHLSATEEVAIPYEEMAQRSHRPVATLRSDVARLRARYRAILREEVRGTTADDSDVDEELRHLCRALVEA